MMHLSSYMNKAMKGLKKYKYAVLVLLLGMALLLMPAKEEKAPEQPTAESDDEVYAQLMEQRLSKTLSQMDGVGRVEVMLSLHSGSYTHYHSDVQQSRDEADGSISEREERKTVILSEGSAYDEAAVTTVDYPKFQGALIVCEGGENAAVRLRLTEAVAALTGLSSEKITVVKMK